MVSKIPKLGEKGKAATLSFIPRPVVCHTHADAARSGHEERLRTQYNKVIRLAKGFAGGQP
jgi:hypothetical protein